MIASGDLPNDGAALGALEEPLPHPELPKLTISPISTPSPPPKLVARYSWVPRRLAVGALAKATHSAHKLSVAVIL